MDTENYVTAADVFLIDLTNPLVINPAITSISIKLVDASGEDLELEEGTFIGPKQIAIKHASFSNIADIDIQGAQWPQGIDPVYSIGNDAIDILTLSVGVWGSVYGVASLGYEI